MSRLIDADGIDEKYREIKTGSGYSSDEEISAKDALYFLNLAIDAMPTVDAVEVVRCKDCKHWENRIVGSCASCSAWEMDAPIMTQTNQFCSQGERRE